MFQGRTIGILFALLIFLWQMAGSANAELLTVMVTEEDSGDLLPCRVRVYRPGLSHESVYCDVGGGKTELSLPAGEYMVRVQRGPDYGRVEIKVIINKGEPKGIGLRLRRLVNLPEKGWWAGEIHVHASPEQLKMHVKAEDLNMVTSSTWHNYKEKEWDPRGVVAVEPNRVIQSMTHELERETFGCIVCTNIKSPLKDATAGKKERPDADEFIGLLLQARKQGAWIDCERPVVNGIPPMLAYGLLDSVGIAANIYTWYRVVDKDFKDHPFIIPWGRFPPGDVNVRQAGLWFMEHYFRILNCGFRIPPSAGTAFPWGSRIGLGYNRMYVHVEGGFSFDGWWKGFKDGRVFITNGPILLVKANGKYPGEIFSSPAGKPVTVRLDIRVAGNDAVEAIEVIRDGRVIERIRGENLQGSISTKPIVFEKSGWFVVRAITSVTKTFRFACTGPSYVEIGDKPKTIRRDDVAYFLKWTQEGPVREFFEALLDKAE
ncbi:MAG: CehA/McbA family metallohydrolase [Planctomycetota bacterium]|jgi:hypothetical protein